MTRKERIAAYRAAVYPLMDQLREGTISPEEFVELHALAVQQLKENEQKS